MWFRLPPLDGVELKENLHIAYFRRINNTINALDWKGPQHPLKPERKIFVFFFRKSINSQTGQPLLLNTSLLRDLNGDTAAIFFPSMRVSTKLRNERGKYRTDRIMSRKSDVRSEGESHRLFLQGYNCHKLLTHTRSRVSVLRTHGLSSKVSC